MLTAHGFFNTAVADEKLSLFTEQYPPYSMTLDGRPFAHDADKMTGLCVDMIKAMLQRIPYESKIKLRDWSYGLNRVKEKLNSGLFCVARTPERENNFKWVGPLTEISWTLFSSAKSNIKLSKLDDIRKYTVGGYKGDALTNYLIGKGYEVSVLNNNQMNPKRLALGQIDLWVADELAGPYIASDVSDIDDLKVALKFKTAPLYLALNPKTNPEIIRALTTALLALKKEGQITAIERSYGR